jgi:hypothetical protein
LNAGQSKGRRFSCVIARSGWSKDNDLTRDRSTPTFDNHPNEASTWQKKSKKESGGKKKKKKKKEQRRSVERCIDSSCIQLNEGSFS